MLKAKFAQTKDCEHCGQTFERKRGRMTDAAWAKARFCCVGHYHAWQRQQGPRGSDGTIRECAATDCNITFWARGSQKFCCDTDCKERRGLEAARNRVKREGTASDLEAFDEKARDAELDKLLAEQRFEEGWGHRAWAGTKNSFVLGFDDLLHLRRSGASPGEDGFDALDAIEFDEYEPFKARAPKQRKRSHVPVRRERAAA